MASDYKNAQEFVDEHFQYDDSGNMYIETMATRPAGDGHYEMYDPQQEMLKELDELIEDAWKYRDLQS